MGLDRLYPLHCMLLFFVSLSDCGMERVRGRCLVMPCLLEYGHGRMQYNVKTYQTWKKDLFIMPSDFVIKGRRVWPLRRLKYFDLCNIIALGGRFEIKKGEEEEEGIIKTLSILSRQSWMKESHHFIIWRKPCSTTWKQNHASDKETSNIFRYVNSLRYTVVASIFLRG